LIASFEQERWIAIANTFSANTVSEKQTLVENVGEEWRWIANTFSAHKVQVTLVSQIESVMPIHSVANK